MNDNTHPDLAPYAARAKVLKAMAHPSRLLILDHLGQREHCVRELTRLVGADMSTVSKHLTVLRNAGLVSDHKRGQQVWCSLRVPCVLRFFDCVEAVLAARD
jgi:ArsR family transcriptional regulator, arsenate/arsenite/antimonite-responsive transcriptional repressor